MSDLLPPDVTTKHVKVLTNQKVMRKSIYKIYGWLGQQVNCWKEQLQASFDWFTGFFKEEETSEMALGRIDVDESNLCLKKSPIRQGKVYIRCWDDFPKRSVKCLFIWCE